MIIIRPNVLIRSGTLIFLKSVRFNSNLIPTLTKHELQLHTTLLSKVSNSDNRGNLRLFKLLTKNRTSEETSLIASQVLSEISPDLKTDALLIEALHTIQIQDIDDQLIQKFTPLLPSLSQTDSPQQPLNKALTKFALLCLERDPQAFQKFRSNIEGGSRGSSDLLIAMYLQTGQVSRAYEYIIEISEKQKTVSASSIELVIHHLCHRESIDKAASLIELSYKENYILYPRTYSTFLTKAIELGNVDVCHKYYARIVEKTYIDNGSLINLIELLNDVLYVRELKDLYTILLRKGSISVAHIRRYRRCHVESLARSRGFERAFELLVKNPPPLLRVSDYPQLLNKVTVSAKLRKVEFVLKSRMSYNTSFEIKRFYLNLILAKLAEKEKIELGIEALFEQTVVRRFISEESMLYIMKGLITNPDIFTIDSMIKVVLDSPYLVFKNPFIINNLLKLIVESQYWFNVFKVYEKIKDPEYKMDPQLYKLLKFKSVNNGFQELLKTINV